MLLARQLTRFAKRTTVADICNLRNNEKVIISSKLTLQYIVDYDLWVENYDEKTGSVCRAEKNV